MGVTGLWKVVEHCARPTKIETLNKKRLAVDASIWIYQFLKAVRDKEGNALRNSHVVGFFRRICKLLFIGILPVFVFDGGAPILKRQTIVARKSRREGRREDAAQTASKLLAREMQRLAEEEEQHRKDAAHGRLARLDEVEEEVPENLVYAGELNMTKEEVQQTRTFRKKDQYHLPDMHASMAEMGAPNDPRVMSLQELETYARQFDTGEDINVYDFSKIDFDGPFFISLPATDRYNILNAARLRSRLRLGHTKEQLDAMFPDRMAFSRFQIERVAERNELTQRLMNINGANEDSMFGAGGSGRIAGEKGREYVLVKNDGVEGGWALGVVSNNKEEGKESKPINVDEAEKKEQILNDDDDDDFDEDFEDVPIEGLNRLPNSTVAGVQQQAMVHKSRRSTAQRDRISHTNRAPIQERAASDMNSLFVAAEPAEHDNDTDGGDADLFASGDEEERLNEAIALSLQQEPDAGVEDEVENPNDRLDAFQQTRAQDARPLPKGRGMAIAHVVNQRAGKAAPKAKLPAPSDAQEQAQSSSSEDEDQVMDLHSLLKTTNGTASTPTDMATAAGLRKTQSAKPTVPATQTSNASGFDGPLPFEKLDLGSSLLGKKKMGDLAAKAEGGFEKTATKKDDAQPLPPWFKGNLDDDLQAQKRLEQSDRQDAKDFADTQKFEFQKPSALRRSDTGLVIDVDAPDEPTDDVQVITDEPLVIEDDVTEQKAEQQRDEEISMGAQADVMRADPSAVKPVQRDTPPPPPPIFDVDEGEDESSNEVAGLDDAQKQQHQNQDQDPKLQSPRPVLAAPIAQAQKAASPSEDDIEWSESDQETTEHTAPARHTEQIASVDGEHATQEKTHEKSPTPEFEDVEIPHRAPTPKPVDIDSPAPPRTLARVASMNNIDDGDDADDYGYYSDSEEEKLMRDLAVEAEEHARFAAEISNKSQQPADQQKQFAEYEKEMKQLRSQQKKDRRDADEVTQIMITECQQLLRLFGLPYITAPMEAEAQCAELVRLGLVDGIVTDDSDCFLFGGTRIYKNMFNQAKIVECYLAPDLEKEYDLSRQKLIDIAQLLGSDYTEGLPGIGHVKALEILSEFPTLGDFKEWWTGVQANTITKSDDALSAFRRKFRRAHVNKLFLPPGFPDPRVAAAYQVPEVDSDNSPFQWGYPDLSALRSFLMATIGWSSDRTDEVLVPVIRDMNRRSDEGTQSNITAFFRGGVGGGVGAYAPRQRLEQGSKRVGSALDRMAKRARGRKDKEQADQELQEGDNEADDGNAGHDGDHARSADAQGDQHAENGKPNGAPQKPAGKKKAATRRRKRTVEGNKSSDEDDE